MSPQSTSQHLLFGILAFQNGLVDQGQFMGAMRQWLKDKTQSLDQILVATGALSSEDRAMLAPMVARHIEDHQGDATLSLATVSEFDSVREQLENLEDADLDQALETVAQSVASLELDKDATIPSAGTGTASRLGSRFRVLRPHKGGGLGYVSIAEDEEIRRLDSGGERGREVALKRIREKYADDPAFRQRFRVEAEITGGLEHPHIVPVYGLGQDETGRPFYAMRFIRGSSLKEAVTKYYVDDEDPIRELDEGRAALTDAAARRRYRFRRLLEKLIDMCEAMHFAHRRGVLHRDLKPGNVMLGRYGEVMVVDWGLAISRERDETHSAETEEDEPTLVARSADDSTSAKQGIPEGTPQYMAPEQATGDIDRLGPRTDIYSLGATLYYVLTGKPPFERDDIGTTLSKVSMGDFPMPRAISGNVPKPLEAICMKAMATRPKDRYATASELAIDLQRWLDGEPVSAWREPWHVRARRWIRNHQRLVTGIATAAAVALVALGITSIIVNEWRKRETAAKEDAKRNYAIANQAIDSFYTKVAEEGLLGQPGMEAARLSLLDDAKVAYEKLAESLASAPENSEESARATYRLGYLLEQLQQNESAKTQFEQALQVQERLFRDSPTEQRRFDLSNTFNAIGKTELGQAKYEQAKKRFDQALVHRLHLAGLSGDAETIAEWSLEELTAKLSSALSTSATTPGHLRKLANVCMNLGTVAKRLAGVAQQTGKTAEYEKQLAQFASYLERAGAVRSVVATFNDYEWNRDQVQQWVNQLQLEFLQSMSVSSDDARKQQFEQVRRQFEQIDQLLTRMRKRPDQMEIERLAIQSTDMFQRIAKASLPPLESVQVFLEKASQSSELARLSPDDPSFAQQGARFLIEAGDLQFVSLGDLVAARQSYRQAIELLQELPLNRDAAYARKVLGKIADRQGELPAAEQHLKQSIAEFEKLANQAAELADARRVLLKVQAKLAVAAGDRTEARRMIQQSIEQWQDRVEEAPDSNDAKWQLEDARAVAEQLADDS